MPFASLRSISTRRQITRFLPLVSGLAMCAAGPANAQSLYSSAGSYTYYVPNGVSSVYVQLWGAGGGAFQYSGGGGAYVSGDLTVSPGEALSVIVGGGGGGGQPGSGDEGGGGYGGGATASVGGGGGRSAIQFGGVDLVDAGGGGGDSYDGSGGAGGIVMGEDGFGPGAGGGGTQSQGGAAGVAAGGMYGFSGSPGSKYQGGTDNNSGGSGGGGGGYYGGGGGGYEFMPSPGFGGGGGGSSLYSGLINFVGQPGSASAPGGQSALNYVSGIGVGGGQANGDDGEVYIRPATTPAPDSIAIFGGLGAVGMLRMRRGVRSRSQRKQAR